jgi:small-conductance mechanosensitive channel
MLSTPEISAEGNLLLDWLLRLGIVAAAVVGALLVRWVIHRLIVRVTTSRGQSRTPAILRPFSERASSALEATGILGERRRQRASTIGSVLSSVTSVILFVAVLSVIFQALKINTGPLVATAGITGVALGFGAQSLVKDYLSGVLLILEDQYGVGDVVDLGNNASGTVEAVGLRVTTVRDAHGVVWYVRNGEITRVGNRTQGFAQVIVDVPIPFGVDLEQAQTVVAEAAQSLVQDETWGPELLSSPEVLGVEQLSATGITLRVSVRTASALQWRLARELRARISHALEEAGIASAFGPPDAHGD